MSHATLAHGAPAGFRAVRRPGGIIGFERTRSIHDLVAINTASAWAELMARVDHTQPWTRYEPTIGHTCTCGCLLKTTDETCPACLVTALDDYERSAA